MRRGREELRRGIRDLIEQTSWEMEATRQASPEQPAEPRPLLRLVRDQVPAAVEPSPPAVAAGEDLPAGMTALLPKKGVCAAYFVNRRCWEIPDAYCNTALQVCMMRECPIYHLHREELERRFARKFAHLW